MEKKEQNEFGYAEAGYEQTDAVPGTQGGRPDPMNSIEGSFKSSPFRGDKRGAFSGGVKGGFSFIREKAGRHKTLIANFSYLSALKIFNMLLPLITLPYLIHVLGKEVYGLIVFAQAVIGYLVILVGYGFNISATKEVSIHRNDKKKLSEIVSSVFILKGILLLISFLILAFIIEFIPQASDHKTLFYLTMWMCVYEYIFPIWYFQGIENMKYVTYLNLLSRIVFVSLIFVFIKSGDDYILVPLINGIGASLAGCISLFIVFRKDFIELIVPNRKVLIAHMKESFSLFLSNLSNQTYLHASKILIGIYLSLSATAIFDLGQKIYLALLTPIAILSQTIFPKNSLEKDKNFIRKMQRVSLIGMAVLIICMFIAAPIVIRILGNNQMIEATNVLRLLSLSLIPTTAANFYIIQTMIPHGYNRSYMRIIITAGLIYIIMIIALKMTGLFSVNTASIIPLVTESYIFLDSFYFCKKRNLI